MSSAAVLTEGRWVVRGGIAHWSDAPEVAEVRDLKAKPKRRRLDVGTLIACPRCRAKVTETCKTTGGNPTAEHAERLVSRRCPCGERVAWKKQLCEPCRASARKQTYRLREIRKATSQRRREVA